MKKTLKLLFVISILTTFISCKKDRVCTCTYTDGSTASQTTFSNVTKKEAKNLCTSSTSGVSCAIN